MISKQKAFEIAEGARHIAKFLNQWEAEHPESVRDLDDFDPRCGSPSEAAAQAMQMARGLTDWMEGRWDGDYGGQGIDVFVASKTFNVLAMAADCGIPLADDQFLKESWAAALYSSGDPAQAELADAVLASAKAFSDLQAELRSSWARELGRRGGAASKGKTSEAKKVASRANGKKGGRPRKRTGGGGDARP